MAEEIFLRDFSPVNIRMKISFLTQQINEMYHLSVSHPIPTTVGLVTIGCSVSDLALWIIDQKNALARYKKRCDRNMKILRQCLKQYTLEEQKEIKRYLATEGRYGDIELMKRVKKDLFQLSEYERLKRHKAFKQQALIEKYKHAEKIKRALTLSRESVYETV